MNGRIMHFIEEREVMASCQSGFREGSGTIDSIICLEDEISKSTSKERDCGNKCGKKHTTCYG